MEEPLKPEVCFHKAKTGDPRALESLVCRLRPRLTKMAAYYALRAQQESDDLLQEAWVGLLEALPELNLSIGVAEQYLLQRARWRLLDAIKRLKSRPLVSLEDAQLQNAPELSVMPALDHAHESEFFSTLNETQAAVLACLLEGKTWREAGNRLGCSSANIAYHVRQIRAAYEKWNEE